MRSSVDPSATSAAWPNIRSAAGFQNEISPSRPTARIASEVAATTLAAISERSRTCLASIRSTAKSARSCNARRCTAESGSRGTVSNTQSVPRQWPEGTISGAPA